MVCNPMNKVKRSLANLSNDKSIGKGPGVYVLYMSNTKTSPPRYVGRSDGQSDVNLRSRLNHWNGVGYKYYQVSNCTSDIEAFNTECEIYHEHKSDLKGFSNSQGIHKGNTNHPDSPTGKDLNCCKCNKSC